MNEDKLTPAQRIRLEALNQAVAASTLKQAPSSVDEIMVIAKRFERWIVKGQDNGDVEH